MQMKITWTHLSNDGSDCNGGGPRIKSNKSIVNVKILMKDVD